MFTGSFLSEEVQQNPNKVYFSELNAHNSIVPEQSDDARCVREEFYGRVEISEGVKRGHSAKTWASEPGGDLICAADAYVTRLSLHSRAVLRIYQRSTAFF